ncbi:MAG: hypothetical protein NTX89_02060 [Candidatus Omnitrophica bacterium]|nr:hypothetical protein [Candidatus Omnitrophota bacterium]
MSVYVYCIKEDYRYQSSLTGSEFENEWFKLSPDGMVIVMGTHSKGYAWDGCSPKFKIKDIYIGVPEAVLNFGTGQSKTYYASLVHDVFYQFSKKVRSCIKRKEVDREFYVILRRDNFRFASLYYFFVRMLGWIWWYRR